MKITRRFARRFRLLTLLRASLAAGCLYNLGLAAALVADPGLLGRTLGLAAPDGVATAWFLPLLTALLLAMLAALYLMTARDPRRYSSVILVAIGGRLAGAALFGAWAVGRPELPGPWVLAAVEGTLGIAHATTWVPLRV